MYIRYSIISFCFLDIQRGVLMNGHTSMHMYTSNIFKYIYIYIYTYMHYVISIY